jgi:WD40 repeat protein/predicted Ser/Thr protein kinase
MNDRNSASFRILFAQALELPPEERSAFLDAACRGEPTLRADVESLLAYDSGLEIGEHEAGFLTSPLVRVAKATTADDSIQLVRHEPTLPTQIGHYRILRWRGEGGMGIVYEAEQDNPRRTVALKVIRSELVSLELGKRFKNEAQILARLQHFGIAQVYEAGMSDDGRPFIAMEMIRGMPLDEYARSRSLDRRARLELLAKVCDAVQYAHDKAVIHRDLKPGNILVEESGQPKVLDFGVAHVTAADVLTTSSQTQTGQLLGTLNYMSPEQLSAHPSGLDGRSDVYTLGVILFELLAQRLPYHLDQLPVHEVARVIEQKEPSRLGSIDKVYRGDLEIIVAKALEKDKTRRYASAGDLASDIRRFLRGEAILARPASALYQIRKFTRRHRALVAGVSGIIAALVVGTVVSIVFALQAAQSARMASEREREASYQSYLARIAAASAALAQHDVVDASRHLDAAPKALRGWEWQHLRSRLDDSSSVFTAAPGERIFRVPTGIRIARITNSGLRICDLDGNELSSRSFQLEHDLVDVGAIMTQQGLRFLCHERDRGTPRPGSRENPISPPKVGWLVDEEGRPQTRLEGPNGSAAESMCVSPDGSRVAVSWFVGKQTVLIVYDSSSGKPVATVPRIFEKTWFYVFSPDGTRIAAASEDGVARLRDTATGKMTAECRGHTSKVLMTAFRADGKRLLTTSADGTVRQWDSATGREVASPYVRHTGEVLTATYSPDGRWIASGGTDRTVRLWDAGNQQDLAVLHGHTGMVNNLAFTADGRRLVSASLQKMDSGYVWDGSVRQWELGPKGSASMLLGHTSYVYPVAYSPDGHWIASGSWDKTVRLWDAADREMCAFLPQETFVRALAFSPDSSWLVVSGGPKRSSLIWKFAGDHRDKSIKCPGTAEVHAIALSPDGAQIASADDDGYASVVDATTGAEVHAFRVAFGGKISLAYSPDGRLLASTSSGGDGVQIDLWDTRTHHRSTRLLGHTGIVHSVAFSADGRLLASGGGDRTVRVWDVAAAQCLAILNGHTDEVFSAVFHPDGTRLASGGSDRAVWLWDLATGQEVARLEGHTNYVYSLAFSPDGLSLVSGSGDGTVRIWDTEPPARRQQARREAETLRPEAERLVERLFREKMDAAEVATAVRADRSLSERQRKAALRAVMRRSAGDKFAWCPRNLQTQ